MKRVGMSTENDASVWNRSARKNATIVLPDGGVFHNGFYENSKDFDRFRKDYDMGNEACLHLQQQRYSQLRILQEGVKLMDGAIVVGELDGLLFDDDTNTAIICEVKPYVRLEDILEVEDKVELYDKFGVANGLLGATKIMVALVGKGFPQHLRERAFKRGIIVLVLNGAGNWRIFEIANKDEYCARTAPENMYEYEYCTIMSTEVMSSTSTARVRL
ncbi:hypothetical protein JKP88DRAFT_252419 [Tribonema minus]|uniref:Uncharacterized protein n=1 Tax=Tribonema minus TaxID=303371 RepID=A0A835ZDI2_9STRA|nr:hypothetical protein JKP88DRAFT_252419 [Tribonema minus]